MKAKSADVPKIGQTFGNVHVIPMFERLLTRAREGKISYAAVVMVEHPHILIDYAGSIQYESDIPQVLDLLKDEIKKSLGTREPPPSDPQLDASYVCYNAARLPVSYDFVQWLIGAEMTRVKEGAPAPLKIAFWRGYSNNLGLETIYRDQMFGGVVKPMLRLFGAVEDEAATNGRTYGFTYADLVRRVRDGEQVARPKPSTQAVAWVREHTPKPFVTVTLREAEHWPHRNSNMAAWTKFADESGTQVIFVRDTSKARERLNGFTTCPGASLVLDIRMALYEAAACNFFVSNGPAFLAFLGTRPCRQFTPVTANSEFGPETASWWQAIGMQVGEQYPWAGADQKIVWAADSYENIRASWP